MSHIEVYVLKPFPWSEDGYSAKYAEAGSTFQLPERLFDGLNKEGYVRRAMIGDGHVKLRPALDIANGHVRRASVGESGPEAIIPLPKTGPTTLDLDPANIAVLIEKDGVTNIQFDAPSIAFPDFANTRPLEPSAAITVDQSTVAAPQPASKTAALTPEEEQALAGGSWKELRFFAQRSIAAKLSSEAVTNGEDVRRVIEAEVARLIAAGAPVGAL